MHYPESYHLPIEILLSVENDVAQEIKRHGDNLKKIDILNNKNYRPTEEFKNP